MLLLVCFLSGILKKTTVRLAHSDCECSDSKCSCDSLCLSAEEESLSAARKTCTPQGYCIEVNSNRSSPSHSGDTNSRISLCSAYILDNNIGGEYHDSASDSAIDLPKGDSSVSTLNESTPCTKSSSPCNDTKQPAVYERITPVANIADCNTSSCNTLTGNIDNSGRITANTNSSHNINTTSSTETIHLEVKLHPPDREKLIDADDDSDDYSTFCIRPHTGPMKTFAPFNEGSKLFGENGSDKIKSFLSKNT